MRRKGESFLDNLRNIHGEQLVSSPPLANIYIHDLIDRRTFITYIMARTSLESERPIMAGSVWILPFSSARHLPHDSLRKLDEIISTNLLIIEPQLKALLDLQRSPLSRLHRHHQHSPQRRSHGRNQRIYRRRGTPREQTPEPAALRAFCRKDG